MMRCDVSHTVRAAVEGTEGNLGLRRNANRGLETAHKPCA
jgi:hypothetical protein